MLVSVTIEEFARTVNTILLVEIVNIVHVATMAMPNKAHQMIVDLLRLTRQLPLLIIQHQASAIHTVHFLVHDHVDADHRPLVPAVASAARITLTWPVSQHLAARAVSAMACA